MIAITGVNGFVGGCVLSFFKEMKVPAIGLSTSLRRENIFALNAGIPEETVKGAYGVIHCGGIVGNGHSKEAYSYNNVECTKNLVHWCEERQVKQFVFLSTGGVYGASPDWVDENAPLNPSGYYAESKVQAEEIVQKSQIPIKTILRLYFPIGVMYHQHFFSRLVKRILANEMVSVNHDKGPWISPIKVNDLAWLINQVISKHYAGIYNVSANKAISMQQIISQIERYSRVRAKIEIKEACNDNYLGNANKIINKVGPYTFVTMNDAIKQLVDSQKLLIK